MDDFNRSSETSKKGDYLAHTDQEALTGYLFKKTREGRWQKRWFETNGVYLTYYKSRKMEKLLAALSLLQVGEIKKLRSEEDPENLPGLFSIELNTRMYVLRATTDEEAEHWVRSLVRIKVDGIASSVNNSLTVTKEELDTFSDTSSVRSASVQSPVTLVNNHNQATSDWSKTDNPNRSGSFFGICC